MTHMHFFDKHRTWEDWLGMALGLVIIATPWIAQHAVDPFVTLSTVAIGLLLITTATMELFDRQRWEETVELFCGLWLAAAPFVLGYWGDGPLGVWHVVIGVVIACVALLELRQSPTG